MDPGSLIIEIVLVGHSIGIVAHASMAVLMGAIMVEKGLGEPIVPVITPEKGHLV
jgi:hypothetical protein